MQKQRNRIEKKRFRDSSACRHRFGETGRRIFVPLRRVAVCSAVAAATALCSRDGRTTSLRNATLPPSPPVSGERGDHESAATTLIAKGSPPCSPPMF